MILMLDLHLLRGQPKVRARTQRKFCVPLPILRSLESHLGGPTALLSVKAIVPLLQALSLLFLSGAVSLCYVFRIGPLSLLISVGRFGGQVWLLMLKEACSRAKLIPRGGDPGPNQDDEHKGRLVSGEGSKRPESEKRRQNLRETGRLSPK